MRAVDGPRIAAAGAVRDKLAGEALVCSAGRDAGVPPNPDAKVVILFCCDIRIFCYTLGLAYRPIMAWAGSSVGRATD